MAGSAEQGLEDRRNRHGTWPPHRICLQGQKGTIAVGRFVGWIVDSDRLLVLFFRFRDTNTNRTTTTLRWKLAGCAPVTSVYGPTEMPMVFSSFLTNVFPSVRSLLNKWIAFSFSLSLPVRVPYSVPYPKACHFVSRVHPSRTR